ncbi:MAG: hypothetical protein HY819_23495 [Acidobacteria bacterium]|nr:hypothetical protein [Acidobacteriota bacterium]
MEIESAVAKLNNILFATLSAFEKTGLVDLELLPYAERAMILALSLFPNQEIAFQIVLDAALNVKHVAYDKSRYRKHSDANKVTKVLLNKVQMFQDMIWLESQKWEKYQEVEYVMRYLHCCNEKSRRQYLATYNLQIKDLENTLKLSEIASDSHLTKLYEQHKDIALEQKDMLARYLKFLIQSSIDNNSFYVALAISHMVYDYSLPQVVDLCVYLNPDVVEGTYLYKLKKKFIEKLKKRFYLFIKWKNETDKELFDIKEDHEGLWQEFIRQCNYKFIPWETDCVAETFNKSTKSFDQHLFESLEKISTIDQVEMSRAHTIICPDCYTCLIDNYIKDTSLHKTKPLQPPKLVVPHFNIPQIEISEPRAGEKEMRKIINGSKDLKQELSNLAMQVMQKAKKTGENLEEIFVFIDGEKKAEFNLKQTRSIRLSLSEDVKLIKVTSHHNNTLSLLAVFVLSATDIDYSWLDRLLGKQKKYFRALALGSQITFILRPAKFGIFGIDNKTFVMDISYQKPLAWQESKISILTLLNQQWQRPFRLVTSFVTVIVIACVLLIYFNLSNKQGLPKDKENISQKQKINKQEINKQEPLSKTPTPQPEVNKTIAKNTKIKEPVKTIAKNTRKTFPQDEQTLSSSAPIETELVKIEQIYIELLDNSSLHEQFYKMLEEYLAKEKIEVLARKDLADALLQGTLKEHNGELLVDIEVVNRKGKILFQERFTGYKDPRDLAIVIVSRLKEKH